MYVCMYVLVLKYMMNRFFLVVVVVVVIVKIFSSSLIWENKTKQNKIKLFSRMRYNINATTANISISWLILTWKRIGNPCWKTNHQYCITDPNTIGWHCVSVSTKWLAINKQFYKIATNTQTPSYQEWDTIYHQLIDIDMEKDRQQDGFGMVEKPS